MSDTVELVVTQHVPAPVKAVWAAWTSAAGWARWWWPHWPDTRYEVDARPGGAYLARSAQGGAGVEGEFVALDPPRALELTWRWDGEATQDRVVVELAPEGDGTLVTVRHTTGSGGADDYRQGWEFVLGNLARAFPAEQGRRLTDQDLAHLRRCVELARAAVESGDQPFGSVLISAAGEELFADHNHVSSGDRTQHPEFAIARWAAAHLSPAERAAATVYTSGEHCAMCSAAHGWVGLGRIVIASSTEQLRQWQAELGVAPAPVAPLPITAVLPDAVVDGPAPELAGELRALHARAAEAARATRPASD